MFAQTGGRSWVPAEKFKWARVLHRGDARNFFLLLFRTLTRDSHAHCDGNSANFCFEANFPAPGIGLSIFMRRSTEQESLAPQIRARFSSECPGGATPPPPTGNQSSFAESRLPEGKKSIGNGNGPV